MQHLFCDFASDLLVQALKVMQRRLWGRRPTRRRMTWAGASFRKGAASFVYLPCCFWNSSLVLFCGANWFNWEGRAGNLPVLQRPLGSSVWFMVIMLFLWPECVCFMTPLLDKGNTVLVMDRPVSMAIGMIKTTFREPHCTTLLLYYSVTGLNVRLSLHGASWRWSGRSGAGKLQVGVSSFLILIKTNWYCRPSEHT